MTRSKREERLTAYHEAGHALAACLVRIPFQDVTIVPTGEILGKVSCSFDRWGEFRPDADVRRRTVGKAKRVMFVALAATVAERIAARQKGMPSNRDDPHVDQALSLCLNLCGSFEESVAYLTFMWEQTKNVVQLHWESVDRLAKGLIDQKTVNRREARRLLKAEHLLSLDLL